MDNQEWYCLRPGTRRRPGPMRMMPTDPHHGVAIRKS